MENSGLIAISRQAVLRRSMDVIANNLANMNTTGFKGEKMMFVEHLVRSRGGEKIGGDRLAFVRDIATARDLSEGDFKKTGNPLDLAIHGDGFFVVGTPGGERYTKNGNFQMDPTGQLVTRNGDPVLSDGGEPFFLSPEDTSIDIASDGTLSTENGVLGKLALVGFENRHDMHLVAGGLYSSRQQAVPVENPNVTQGMLESSNIQPIVEMTRMIEVHRSYESIKSFVEREDERQKQMIREMARVA
jgi:flagellar basal-body rod protein FlgF